MTPLNSTRFLSFLFLGSFLLILTYCTKPETSEEEIYEATPFELEHPEGFPPFKIPDDNKLTVEGVKLGRFLFYDTLLSADLTKSCSSCHIQEKAFSDPNPTSTGVNGAKGRRNAMVLFNLIFQEDFFWDGRAQSLEEQSLHPIEDPLELNMDLPTVIARLEATEKYPKMFKAAFGTRKITKDRIAKAIAQFERTLISANSEYDRVKRPFANRNNPFDNEAANRGLLFFNNGDGADCFHCHDIGPGGAYMGGGYVKDLIFVNNGLKEDYTGDFGRMEVTNDTNDYGSFKVPSIRNVIQSAPFMHDGSLNEIRDVIAFYETGGFLNGNTHTNMEFAGKGNRNFTDDQKADLIAFLETLTDWEFLQDTAFSNPFEK